MSIYSIVFWSLAYLLLLFGIATWAEIKQRSSRSIVANNPYIYALSLTIYCTAWTFYGSVGHATVQGADFLTVFLGPAICVPLWWIIFRKIIRICKIQRITNIADFISARYGKNQNLGVVVTLLCIVGLIPYISIQLKAISISFSILADSSHSQPFIIDYGWYITLALGVFTILFGVRKLEANERHEGLVAAIAFESMIKLIAFLSVGFFVTFIVYDGFDDLTVRSLKLPELKKLFTINSKDYSNWFWHCVLSGLAIMFLPRQFQVAVVENYSEKHLKKALWLFPLYLLIINIFVLPIALGGELLFDTTVKADQFVLSIPLYFKNEWLALLTYIGGFSAASSMVMVECTALSVMLTNNLAMPYILSRSDWQRLYGDRIPNLVLNLRRIFVFLLLLLAYLYYRLVSDRYSLVSVGLVSFAAVAQMAPSVIGGIFWKRGSLVGAMDGLIMGSFVWFYTLIIPSMASADLIPLSILTNGPFGIEWLRPQSLFGLTGLDSIAHGTFWSLSFNLFFYVYGSLYFRQSALDHKQAVLFVDIFKYSEASQNAVVWKGKALITDIRSLLNTFFGVGRTSRVLSSFARRYKLNLNTQYASPQIVNYAEQMLTGAIGAASARIVVSSVAKEEQISIDEVIDILKTSQELKNLNQQLTKKSLALEQTTQQLKEANEKLKLADQQKDEFLTTVTHEIRTPLTSIKSLTEIIQDNPDIEIQTKEHFFATILKEIERLARLINDVLDIERIDTGKFNLSLEKCSMPELVRSSLSGLSQVAKDKGVKIIVNCQKDLPIFNVDRDRMIQVLINLLANAVKFCPSQAGIVEFSAERSKHQLIIKVRDNGLGVDESVKYLIFDKFYQAKARTTHKPEGSGLGLAISKKILELHNGSISVKNNKSNGCVFTIKLPVFPHEK